MVYKYLKTCSSIDKLRGKKLACTWEFFVVRTSLNPKNILLVQEVFLALSTHGLKGQEQIVCLIIYLGVSSKKFSDNMLFRGEGKIILYDRFNALIWKMTGSMENKQLEYLNHLINQLQIDIF